MEFPHNPHEGPPNPKPSHIRPPNAVLPPCKRAKGQETGSGVWLSLQDARKRGVPSLGFRA